MVQGEDFNWQRYPEVDAFITGLLDQFKAEFRPARNLAAELMDLTGSRLVDWLDHLVLAGGGQFRGQLAELGFAPLEVPAEPGDAVFHYPGGLFPRIVLRNSPAGPGTVLAAAILVEDSSVFLMTHRIATRIEGTPFSPYRRAQAWQEGERSLWVVERRGHNGLIPVQMPPDYVQRYRQAYERWATRPRSFDDRKQGMEQTLRLARSMAADLGADTAAGIVFEAERAFWERRNWAGQVQKARQERVGLGWANHDHHAFRSSRDVFPLLLQILKTLGFQPRERFYAGAEAGWGAQVLEQPACRLAVFADVDLSPGEIHSDFSKGLAKQDKLSTVGLWCALHGESMLEAGPHHIAARLAFETANADLAQQGIESMRPFSDFPYLKQTFTRGERWQVPDDRLAQLEAAGQIDAGQRERLAFNGAVGSHLENIQRGDGFKGFNQQTVSDIIRRTDPRSEFQTT